MEQIIRHFGRGMWAVAVALFLIAMLFGGNLDKEKNRGIVKMAGAAIKPGSICYTVYADYKELQREAEKPEIFLREKFKENVIYAGEDYCLSDFIEAVDEMETHYPISLEKIYDKEGKELENLHFEKSGIYTLQIMVKNDAGKKKRYQVTVPVASRKERNKIL